MELYSRNSRKGFPWALNGFLEWKERLLTTCRENEAGTAGWASSGSVDEALARLLPAAGGAPHVPVFHAINLAALFAFTSGLP